MNNRFLTIIHLAVYAWIGYLNPLNSQELAASPPLGWNSFDSYNCNIYEEIALKEADAFIEKFAPYGYEYFVIDNGWFSNPKSVHAYGYLMPTEKHADPLTVTVNEFGIVQPSPLFFPNGFGALIDKLHAKGLKFGVHLMRGIPRIAVQKNLPIKGTNYTAQDIYTTVDDCGWCKYMHGVDMTKPGAQEYYNSVVYELAAMGVDFIKVDHVTHKPAEIEAYAKAIKKCGRPIILSLSAGGTSNLKYLSSYQKANMIRTTPDIWDNQKSIENSFTSMRKWQGLEQPGTWPDLDMVPFGELCILKREEFTPNRANKTDEEFSGYLYHWCKFTKAQKETFITQRSISASPIMIGGSMISMDKHSIKLLTNKEMLACVKNGIHGKLTYKANNFEMWHTPAANTDEYGFQSYTTENGWIAIFNRVNDKRTFTLKDKFANTFIKNHDYLLIDVWNDKEINYSRKDTVVFDIEANGVLFFKYKLK